MEINTSSVSKDFANKRGTEVQQGVCKLLGTLNYVLWVRETTKDSPEDRSKIDLIVGLDQNKKNLVVPEVAVQVKASTTGVTTFKHHIRKSLSNDHPKGNISREEWMLKQGLILLVGDVRISRSRKSRWPITNEEIIASFETQLKNIDNYRRSKLNT